MRIANLESWKKTFEQNYPIKIDHFIYNLKLNQYECEWLESEEYCKVNEIAEGDGIGGCVGKKINDIKDFLEGRYNKEDLHLY